MIAMRITIPLAGIPIDDHSAAGLISIAKFPPSNPAASRSRVVLVQFEVDGQIVQNVNRLTVERSRFELPSANRFHGGLVETERQRLENVHVGDVAALVDGALDDDDSGDARLA